MTGGKDTLGAILNLAEEKARLMEAAGLFLLAPAPGGHGYLRPIVAGICTLALCLLPMVSAGEGAYGAIARLSW